MNLKEFINKILGRPVREPLADEPETQKREKTDKSVGVE